jgi:C4-type Zn-finger protein
MTWNAGDEHDCYECGKELGRNRVSEKVPFLKFGHLREWEPVCEDCYIKLAEGPQQEAP